MKGDILNFFPRHAYLICVDSDGCAVDTMDVKHKRCFGPCMVAEWGLEQWEAPILKRWNEVNLYTMTRGINRFKGLAMVLGEADRLYQPIEGVRELQMWTDNAAELSNEALEAEIRRTDSAVLKKALSWSKAVNRAICELPWEVKKAFPGVKEAFMAAKASADICVVSSANRDAVEEEWQRFGLLDLVDLTLCQDAGNKAHCIGELKKKGFAADHILMVGDAPGDEDAAAENGVLYYPILVGREAESWERFRGEALPRFLCGTYAGGYQAERKAAFRENLGRDQAGDRAGTRFL